jgi:hypothetical protein
MMVMVRTRTETGICSLTSVLDLASLYGDNQHVSQHSRAETHRDAIEIEELQME